MITFTFVVIVIAVVWWWWQNRSSEEQAATTVKKSLSPAPVVEEPVAETVSEEPVSFAIGAAETPEPSDLKRVEGIGPKISSILQENGILTFEQLAATDADHVRQILMDAGLRRLADPTTWPEQAGLAAAGKWDELEKLQDELQGGRRV